MEVFRSILDCIRGNHTDDPQAAITRMRSEEDISSEILTILLTAESADLALKKRLDETVSAYGWTDGIAQAILHGLENAIQAASQMGAAAADALLKATEAAFEFAKEHPIYTTILALGVLVILAPWVIEVLGFGELGPIEGSWAAAWQSMYGDVPKGAIFTYFQRLGMIWKH